MNKSTILTVLAAAALSIRKGKKGDLAYNRHKSFSEVVRNRKDPSSIEHYRRSWDNRSSSIPAPHSNRYEIKCGGRICWQAEKQTMIEIPFSKFEYVRNREDNIFDYGKLNEMAFIVKKLRDNDEYALFDPGYCEVTLIGLDDVIDSLQYDENELSTGDSDLDMFLKNEKEWIEDRYPFADDFDLDEVLLIADSDLDDEEIERIIESKIEDAGYVSLYADEVIDAAREIKEMKESCRLAQEQEWGDIGELSFQIRDGNHRTFGAIAGGERSVYVKPFSDFMDIVNNPGNFSNGKYVGRKCQYRSELLERFVKVYGHSR